VLDGIKLTPVKTIEEVLAISLPSNV